MFQAAVYSQANVHGLIQALASLEVVVRAELGTP